MHHIQLGEAEYFKSESITRIRKGQYLPTSESLTLDSLLTDPQQHVAVLKVIMLKLVKAAVCCTWIKNGPVSGCQ